jgi:hypothetical protein
MKKTPDFSFGLEEQFKRLRCRCRKKGIGSRLKTHKYLVCQRFGQKEQDSQGREIT